MSALRSRLTFSNVVSLMALFAVLGGGAWAASRIGGGGKVNACYRASGKSKGLVRVVPTGAACKHGEKSLAWNVRGPRGATGAGGVAGVAGTNGVNGAKGDKGDTGAPGSTIVARLQGSHETLASGAGDSNVGFTPNTWAQAQGEDQLVMAVATTDAPFTGCTGNQSLLVTINVNGFLLDPLFITGPGAKPFHAVPVPVLNPQVGGTNTITASAANTCPNSATFHVDVDIVSFK